MPVPRLAGKGKVERASAPPVAISAPHAGTTSRLYADIALLVAAAVWGISFLFQKSAMDHVGPLAFIAARSVVAALALAPLALREQRRAATPTGARFWLVAVSGGLAFFVAAWLQQAGLRSATVTNSSFLTALYVVLTPFVVWAWSGKVPALVVWPAVALSVLGTWLLGGGGSLTAFSAGDRLWPSLPCSGPSTSLSPGRPRPIAGPSPSRPYSSS